MRILLVEDDLKLSDSLSFQLVKEGFAVDLCHDGEEAVQWILQHAHDLVLLDRMIPGLSGTEVVKLIRSRGIAIPVILITALGELNDKVSGLDSGADDYIVKPFAFEELMARIRSINRRPFDWRAEGLLTLGDISFDIFQKQLFNKEASCSLSKKEADLLEMFMRNPGQTLPRDILLSRVWGLEAEVGDGNLDNYIHFLRRRLKAVNSCLKLKTVRGVGYCLEEVNV